MIDFRVCPLQTILIGSPKAESSRYLQNHHLQNNPNQFHHSQSSQLFIPTQVNHVKHEPHHK